ncbi:MAG: type II toxin-antitoxin system RelE/ParE family toxin [Eubacteriales bacterium]|nr:type II toxin-antitoxin system RelE/ParE family toxin [Eubacteriales bacterium]
MAYNLIISEKANQHIEQIVEYIMFHLQNPEAAKSVLDDLEHTYHLLEQNAESFPYSEDPYLAAKGYRKLSLQKHAYVILYKVADNTVQISGVFHTLQDYRIKL